MSGMLSQVLMNQGPEGGLVSNQGWYQPVSLTPFKAQEARIPVPILTYRSGPRYFRAIEQGALPMEDSILELYARLQGDTGHEFRLFKTSFRKSYSYGTKTFDVAGHAGLTGPGAQSECLPQTVSSSLASYTKGPWAMSDAQLVTLGTGFIQDSDPLASEADLLVSLAELIREGLPKSIISALLKPGSSRKALIKGAGSDYLNYTFGITPIVRDFDKVWRTLTRIDDIINQWIRDNAREIRRRRRTKVTSVREDLFARRDFSDENVNFGYFLPSSGTDLTFIQGTGNPSPDISYVRKGSITTQTQVSFSSRFNYHLEELGIFDVESGEISESNLSTRLLLTLHALGLSPKDFSLLTVWNLVPFSWLVDWFVNVGDLLSNVRSFQTAGLHLTYGYVTAYQKRRVTWESQMTFGNPGGSVWAECKQGQSYVEKHVRRIRATPFGFGVTYDGLTPYQSSILVALASQALQTGTR